MKLVDLASRMDTRDFRELLLMLVGWRDDRAVNLRALNEAIDEYRSNPQRHVLGVEENGALVGMIGLSVEEEGKGVIHHIVVHPFSRHNGIGRAMISAATQRFDLRELSAETDAESAEFYGRLGFDIQSLGEKYPGTQRFWCVKQRPV